MKKSSLIVFMFTAICLSTNAQNNSVPVFLRMGAAHVKFSKPAGGNSTAMSKTGTMFLPGRQINSAWDEVGNAWNFQDSLINTYNISGKITLLLDYYSGASYPDKTVYVYNANGKETSDTSYSWNGSSYSVGGCTTYLYDAKNNLTKQAHQSWNGVSWVKDYEDNYTYDANNNQTEDLQYNGWNGSGWDYGYKSDITWSAGQMTQEIVQTLNGTAWVNESKFVYTYAGGQLNGGTGYSWDGSTWQNEAKIINVVWYQWKQTVFDSKLSSYTGQVPNGTGWKDSSKVNYTYDNFGNQTDYLEQAKPAATYITSSEQKDIFQYDGNNNITQDIEQDWLDATTGLQNNMKREYGAYQSFTAGIASIGGHDDEFVLFPNPSNGIFHLQNLKNTISSITVFNLVGEIVYQSSDNTLQTEINLSNQPKGIYFVQITIGNSLVKRKIILH